DRDPVNAFQFSRRVADLFDQYVVYRPDMISRWENNNGKPKGHEAWQRELWRALGADRALTKLKAEQGEAKTGQSLDEFTEQFYVFGLTTISPAYLDTLFRLSKLRPVHLFRLTNSKEYHGQDLTPKRRAQLNIKEADAPIGNPLLTSLGTAQAHL